MITNLLLHNPYRILGVFSNAPKKDVLSNINKMKAFLKVGKEVSFPLDLPTLLPAVHREETTVTAAQAAIELPIDQIKHTLFWFIKMTPFDEVAFNHLFTGNICQAKDIWSKKESVSSLLNLMSCALIEEDWTALAINADSLFQRYSNEFCSTVNETVKLSSSQLTELYVAQLKADSNIDLTQLAQVSGTSVEWKKVLGGSLVKPIVDEISYAISEAKGVKGSSANYNAGVKLMNSTKGSLIKLKGLIGTSDMQYQMIADKLATTILQCGINYFNDTEEDTAVEKAMTLQNYALSIAVGQMARERCKENVDILKKIGPEYKVQKEIERLGNKLNAFKNKKRSTSLSGSNDSLAFRLNSNFQSDYKTSDVKEFIAGCQPDLSSVARKLGTNDAMYIKISSAIAAVAINAIIDIVNKAQTYASITRNSGDLTWPVMESVGVMRTIGQLTMDSECREYYQKNYNALCNIQSQLMPKPQPSSSSGGCYIATMAYGDYDHPQVMVLRNFRDTYLAKREWGQKFISYYYRHSPGWVEKLRNHKHINYMIRRILDSFVSLWKKSSHYE